MKYRSKSSSLTLTVGPQSSVSESAPGDITLTESDPGDFLEGKMVGICTVLIRNFRHPGFYFAKLLEIVILVNLEF